MIELSTIKENWVVVSGSIVALFAFAKKWHDVTSLKKRVADLESKKCTNVDECEKNQHTCQAHMRSEFQHGSARFDAIDKTLDDNKKEIREDMKNMEDRVIGTIQNLLG